MERCQRVECSSGISNANLKVSKAIRDAEHQGPGMGEGIRKPQEGKRPMCANTLTAIPACRTLQQAYGERLFLHWQICRMVRVPNILAVVPTFLGHSFLWISNR